MIGWNHATNQDPILYFAKFRTVRILPQKSTIFQGVSDEKGKTIRIDQTWLHYVGSTTKKFIIKTQKKILNFCLKLLKKSLQERQGFILNYKKHGLQKRKNRYLFATCENPFRIGLNVQRMRKRTTGLFVFFRRSDFKGFPLIIQ